VTKLAGVACRWRNFDDGFRWFEAELAREKKGGEGGGTGLFIGARFLAGGGMVARGEEDTTVEVRRARSGLWPEEEGDLLGGPGMSAR
jgi:hypothetical protein